MKIILLNTFELNSGAAIACNRLMKALIEKGVNAKTLVLSKQTDDKNVISVYSSFIQRQHFRINFLLERFVIFLNNHQGNCGCFQFNNTSRPRNFDNFVSNIPRASPVSGNCTYNSNFSSTIAGVIPTAT